MMGGIHMIRKIAFFLSILVIGFAFGYGGYNMAFAKHHHPIPGIDIPFNPGAYYSPTALDYADSPSTFALRDLARNGGTVFDYARNIKNVLTTKNVIEWLKLAAQKTGLDILNSTKLPPGRMDKTGIDIFAMNATADKNNQSSTVSDLINGTLFRTSTRYDEYANDYDTQEQQQALEDTYTSIAQSAQEILRSSDTQMETYQRILEDAANAPGEMQVQQAQVEAEAFQQAQTAQRNALLSNLATLKAMESREKMNEELEYTRLVDDAQLQIQDPYHRSALEQKQYEATNPTPPKGFVEFK